MSNIVNEALAGALSNDDIREMVQTQARRAVEESIKSAFRYGTDLHKKIEEVVAKTIKLNVQDITPPEYEVVLAGILKEKLDDIENSTARENLLSLVDETLKPAPEEISLQEIINIFISEYKEECACEIPDDLQIEIEQSDFCKWVRITNPNISYEGTFSFAVSIDDGHIFGVPLRRDYRMNAHVYATMFKLQAYGTRVSDIKTVHEGYLDTRLHDLDI